MMDKTIKEEIAANIQAEEQGTQKEEISNLSTGDYAALQKKMEAVGFNPNGSKSLEEWIVDGLHMRNEKITDLYKSINDLKELTDKQVKHAVNTARAQWEEQRDSAIARGDVQAVKELERNKEQYDLMAVIQAEAAAFTTRNADWYSGTSPINLKMRKAAEDMDVQLAKQKLPPKEHFAALENYVKEEFKSYFAPQEEETHHKPSAVSSGSSVVDTKYSRPKKYTMNDLNPAQQSIAKRLINQKLFTFDEYVNKLVESGDL